VRASDGVTLGTFSVGTSPAGIAFDGTNIWVTNRGSNTVSELRASDGTTLGTFSVVGALPVGIAFDGANFWVANNGSNFVSKF
jgi:DNA-binding beta-propeller fold protein YncE